MISLKHLKNCGSVLESSISPLPAELTFCTDTRKYKHPSAFVAIPGEKVNPLDVINSLLEQECPLVVFEHNDTNSLKVATLKEKYPKTVFLPVVESVKFLQELSHLHILEWKLLRASNKVFAISGSNGKTTHKEMLSMILKKILPGKVVSTEKNNNNHLGVPLTLLQVNKETEIVVLELGSNHPGEIKVLCDIAVPDSGLTTNIGATHLEFFGTEKNVFDEEAYLYHAVKERTDGKGFYLINTDDQYLKTLLPFAGAITFGENGHPMAKISFQDYGASIEFRSEKLVVSNRHITGKHNKLNLVTCAFIALQFYPRSRSEIIAAAADFTPTKNRSEWIEFEGKAVFLDAYNANPSSMKAALEGFKESVISQGHKLDDACVVLGDMNELGSTAPIFHKETGEFVKSLGFSHVFFIGRFAAHYQEGCPQGQIRASAADFKIEYRNECLKHHQIHFIKGSRSLQLESLFDIT